MDKTNVTFPELLNFLREQQKVECVLWLDMYVVCVGIMSLLVCISVGMNLA